MFDKKIAVWKAVAELTSELFNLKFGVLDGIISEGINVIINFYELKKSLDRLKHAKNQLSYIDLFGKIRQEDQSRMINYLKCEANYISREGIYDILIDFQKQVKINSVSKTQIKNKSSNLR